MQDLKIGKTKRASSAGPPQWFRLPIDRAVTETFAILAKRGVGKTYTAKVMAEEMLENGAHVVIVDPIGVWHGLRSSADGKAAGYPIIVLGGEHGDAPLEPTGGQLVADFIVSTGASVILDLGLFRKNETVRFMTDFAETLYRRNREALHLILDEADVFAPQKPPRGAERMLGAMEDIVRRGRARGIGVTMVTQRSASINKDVLTQTEVLIAMRTNHPRDRDAIEEWIRVHGEKESRDIVMDSLASLPIGTAWVWSPGWLEDLAKVEIRKARTFDSSATPEMGRTVREPSKVAKVDLEALTAAMNDTIRRSKDEDPKELRNRLREAEEALQRAEKTVPEPVIERVEVPILTDEDRDLLAGASADLETMASALQEAGEGFRHIASKLEGLPNVSERVPAVVTPLVTPQVQKPAPRVNSGTPDVTPRVTPPASSNGQKLAKAERSILSVLAQFRHKYPAGQPKKKVAVISGYSHSGGAFNNALSSLRSKGFIEKGDPIRITDEGFSAIDGSYQPLPMGPALASFWMPKLGKAERSILEQLTANRRGLMKDDLAEMSGYEMSGGAFNNALSRLRTLHLIEGKGSDVIQATEDLR